MGSKEIVELLSESSDRGEDDRDSSAVEAEKFIEDSANAILDLFNKKVASVDAVLRSLNEIVILIDKDKDLQLPIYVFIDELDRCRPTYAIEVLEIVKHIFSASGVQFVVATDTDQLEHTVKSVYGSGFDAKRYLRRFFDDRYTFPAANYTPIFDKLVESDVSEFKMLIFVPDLYVNDNHNVQVVLSDILHAFSKLFNWSVRDQVQIYEEIKRIVLFNFQRDRKCHVILLVYFISLRRILDESAYDYVSAAKSTVDCEKRFKERTGLQSGPFFKDKKVFHTRSRVANGTIKVRITLSSIIQFYLGLIGLNQDMLRSKKANPSFSFEESVIIGALAMTEQASGHEYSKYSKLITSFGGLGDPQEE